MSISIALVFTYLSTLAQPLVAERLYNGLDRPVIVQMTAPTGSELVLLNGDGSLISGPMPIQSDRMDISKEMPEVWALERAAYLQLIINGQASGSPLVLEPLRSRMVPQVTKQLRPDGETSYQRIDQWKDEAATDSGSSETEENNDPVGGQADSEKGTTSTGAMISGLRIYPERDVKLNTSEGEIVLQLRPDAAPNTSWNFRQLVDGGFYRLIPFHRIVPLTRDGHGFVIQAGDPTGTGEGGPGYWLPIEPSTLPHDFGVISMARADEPDSAGSQIFICLSREGTARLDGQYASFGEAVQGGNVIVSISKTNLEDPATGRPETPPMILDAVLIDSPAREPGIIRKPISKPIPEE
ncbi:MAG: peptidylprolyl isomerase [Phycisphaerales bacterium]|nr:peptidylprolyl isomerase [Phycisphaerales bacterium]